MKTTLELPDELMREVKIRAARENRRIKDVVAELLERGLIAGSSPKTGGRRVQFPIIAGGHPAASEDELTPDRVADILLAADTASLHR